MKPSFRRFPASCHGFSLAGLSLASLSLAWFSVVMVASSCQRMPPPKPISEYQMHGEIIRLDASGQLATVKHDKIQGWMDAMTMEYPVRDKQAFEQLKVGETIEAKIQVQGTDFWISSVSPAPAQSNRSR
jgi:Cu/Ag efflux protein CusF